MKTVVFTRVNRKTRYESSGKLFKIEFSLWEQSSLFMAEIREASTALVHSRSVALEIPAVGSRVCKA